MSDSSDRPKPRRRYISPQLKADLRREVNYGCPVKFFDGTGCGCPILTYHHFDPPWAGNYINNPAGMIALCREHADQADGGHWSKEQLRWMKREPYVDSEMRVRWPWQAEELVIKMGPAIVVGSGAPLRLNGRRILGFRPQAIESLGVRTVLFDSEIRDQDLRPWLRIENGWFDMKLAGTTDMFFTPQTKTFKAVHRDGTHLSLRFSRRDVKKLSAWIQSKVPNKRRAPDALAVLEKACAIPADGQVPVIELRGFFRTRDVDVVIAKEGVKMYVHLGSYNEKFDIKPLVVNEDHRVILRRQNGPDIFSLG